MRNDSVAYQVVHAASNELFALQSSQTLVRAVYLNGNPCPIRDVNAVMQCVQNRIEGLISEVHSDALS
ncbi:hypothetical protein D3C79_747850 [compost metagenome]